MSWFSRIILAGTVAVALASSAVAQNGSKVVFAAAANGQTGAMQTGARASGVTFTFCGTGFSGNLYVDAAATSSALAQVWTTTLTLNSDCATTYAYSPASKWYRVRWTRSAGKLDVWMSIRQGEVTPGGLTGPVGGLTAGRVALSGSATQVSDDEGLQYDPPTDALTVGAALNARNVTAIPLPASGSVTVVNQGTAGATTYTYSVQACLADGTCNAAGPASTTTTGNATLSATDSNRLSWSAVSGSALYKIRRDVGGATQGVIWSGTALTVDDTGLAGDSSAKPTVDGTGVVTAGRVLVRDGTAADPSVAFASYPSLGFHKSSLGLGFDVDGAIKIYFDAANKQIRNDALGVVGWTASNAGAALDTFLTRAAAATLQLGAANSATPVAQTLKVQDATGSNANAASTFTIKAPAGRGTGTRGKVVIQTPQVAASGDNAQTQADRLTIAESEVTTNIGTGTATARVGGVLHVYTTERATTGTTEEVLVTYTMPANTLARNGQAVRITAWGVGAANGNSKTVKLRFSGAAGATFAIGTAALNGTTWRLQGEIIRTGATTQVCSGTSVMNTAIYAVSTAGTVTLANASDIVVTGTTATAAGDVTILGFLVEALN